MNNWNYQWPGYYPVQSHPHVYIPPQPYNANYPSWNAEQYNNTKPTYRSAKYPNLNPILASDTTLLRFDVKKKPRSEILASTYYTNRHSPATANGVTQLRLISKSFPWIIDIVSPVSVTCEAVWDALYAGLQEPLVDSEWALIATTDKKHREVVVKAARKREETETPAVYRRIDYLGDATLFKGLDRDEEYEKSILLPGAKTVPETWVVKLGS